MRGEGCLLTDTLAAVPSEVISRHLGLEFYLGTVTVSQDARWDLPSVRSPERDTAKVEERCLGESSGAMGTGLVERRLK